MRIGRRPRDVPFPVTHAGLTVVVTRKANKNIYLRVHRASGEIRLTAPYDASDAKIRSVIESHGPWIEHHLTLVATRPAPTQRSVVDGIELPILGMLPVVNVNDRPGRSRVELREGVLTVFTGERGANPHALVESWLRAELRTRIQEIVARYEPVMGVRVADIGVRQMKTRWGTCNINARRIWLNLELGWLDPVYLDYVVLHEMVHLLERGHNRRFYSFMDQYMPAWKHRRKELREIGIQPR
jgi:predicted metal-dependent hydrolase